MYKFLLLLLFFTSSSVAVHAQNKIAYYELINKANDLVIEKQLDEAFHLYKKAVQISPKMPYDGLTLTSLSIQLKKFKEAEANLKLSIANGAYLGMIEADSTVNVFFKSDTKWPVLYTLLRQKYLSKIPYLEEREQLLEMINEGQNLRSLFGVLDFKKVDSLIFIADTTHMARIHKIIKKIGFPDIEKVGLDGSNAIFIILMHTLNNWRNDEQNLAFFYPMLKKAVQELKFIPNDMAILVDRHKAIHKQEQIYGSYWVRKNDKEIITAIQNIKEVDKRRMEIGLPPLSVAKKRWGQILPEDYPNN